MSNTGYIAYTNLEQYYLDSGVATGLTKPNSPSDPDYIAPVLNLTLCPLPSITPSISVSVSATPSISISPSLTPSVTPSISPSISVTPSLTPSISVTPSISPSISVTPSVSITPSVTPSITPSPSPGYAPQVINAQGYLQACIGGTCDDYLGWFIYLDQPVTVDTYYNLDIVLYQYGMFQSSYSATGIIPAGSSSHNSDPCLGGGTYVGCNYSVNSTCVAYIDSPVNPSIYGC